MLREDKLYNSPMATAGGVAFLVPQRWSCHKVNLNPVGAGCEALMIILTPAGENAKTFKLCTMYNHPGHHISPKFITHLKAYQFNGKSLPMLLVGDLNSPHHAFGSRLTNEFGSSLLQVMNS